jgi:uncharacterized coiled-coil protein SlyX
MTDAPASEAQGGEQPEAAPPVTSSGLPVILVCLAAVTVIGAATANFLPSLGGLSLAQFSLPDVDRLSMPDFSRFSPPSSKRVALPPPPPAPPPAPVLVPDPVVRAGLRDIQSTQQQDTEVLAQLTQGSAAQQADLKRITRQLALLTAQVSSLQNQVTAPLTTSSIPLSTTSGIPLSTSIIPRPNPRARVVRASRRVPPPVLSPVPPPTLPPGLAPSLKPEGPFSVGGAPLSPAPGSGAS